MTRKEPEGAASGALRFSEATRLAAVLLLFLLNTLFFCVPLLPLTLLKAAVSSDSWRTGCTRLMRRLGAGWIGGAKRILRLLPTSWDVEVPQGLDRRSWYLLLANHQTWADILVLVRVFGNRIPFPVFFAKKELRRFPLIGQAMWGLDYPFVERYPREVLARRPELRGRDRKTVRAACLKARSLPTALIVFPEGTRFTPDKHSRQGSPFRRLLRPRPGGTATVLDTLGDRLAVLDVTLVYPGGPPSFIDFLAGKAGKVAARARFVAPPAPSETEERRRVQEWLDGIWREKETLVGRLMTPPGGRDL